MTTRFERRGLAMSVGLLGMLAAGSGGNAAVLPYAEPLAPPASMRAGLLAPVAADMAGQWVGLTPDGQVIAVTLRMDAGLLAGDASLEALVAQVRGRQPLARPEARGATVSFEVKSTPCAKSPRARRDDDCVETRRVPLAAGRLDADLGAALAGELSAATGSG